MFTNTYIILTALAVIGFGWDLLIFAALAVLLQAAFAAGRPTPRARRTSSHHARPMRVGSRPSGVAPPRPARGATA
jgi:hypothetical protein